MLVSTKKLAALAVTGGLALSAAVLTPAPASGDPGRPPHAGENGWVTSTLRHMTIEEKVGQLFVTHVYGNTVDSTDQANVDEFGLATPREIIERYHLGGVLYFAWTHSVDNPTQAAGLSNGVQEVMTSTGAEIPGFVSIDQEGGLVARVLEPATQTPGNMALGATRDVQGTRDLAAIQGEELAAMGVNMNFAPVADVNVNPANPVIGVRSFSSDPGLASTLTAAQVNGYEQDAGISSTAKHFPGHGDTAVDSHYGFPVITHTREEWETIDKPPFEAAIDAGIDAIMTAHIQVPALDPSGDPATLSKPILTGILREEMGYDGVVITDALGMGGASATYPPHRVPVLALLAGVDMLLKPPDGQFDVMYNAVLDAVASGELTEERIDTSVRRILTLKESLGIVEDPYVDPAELPEHVGTQEHLDTLQQITDRSTTLVRNQRDLLPLEVDPGEDALVTGWGVSTTGTVAAELTERGIDADAVETGLNPTDETIAATAKQARHYDNVVVITNRAGLEGQTNQATLVRRLIKANKHVIAVGVRDAYDVNLFPKVRAYVATYSYTPAALDSLARVLVGELDPTGRLPVTIPQAKGKKTLYPYGHGLEY